MANVTVDDANPSIVYLPDGAWNTRNPSTLCPSCTANPNYTMMFDDTFHDGTFNSVSSGSNKFPNVPLTASMSFNGTAVYIFCALADSSTSPYGDSDMTFYIDGAIRGTFIQTAPGTPKVYQYSVPVFSLTSLSPGQHTLTIQNGHVNGTRALILLDEIIYTDASTISSSASTTSPISSQQSSTSTEGSAKSTKQNPGIIIGSIVAVALGFALFFWWRWRRPHSISPWRTMIDPDNPSSIPMSEPLSTPSSHPAYSSDAPTSFGITAAPYSSWQANSAVPDIQPGVQQSTTITHDAGSPLPFYPSSALQPRHVEDEATLDDAPPAYDELRRIDTAQAVMNQ
ncbi:hypothetical protein BDP27DRAFT_1400695 [Rhodocollybia butyracea]|uniref:Uncharacterized protein n=1 Tax=Rhodocollybia butyracea TaxID=206335 RepID=A0A9P5Q2A7_9AGAR|nr:hypothetical protein BDP27DRAFT_1400695 [Rhodocollybia butyracea]